MHIDTHSYSSMQSSILKYLNVKQEDMAAMLVLANEKANTGLATNEAALKKDFDEFLNSHSPSEKIDEILFFHLSRRLNSDKNLCVGNNLFDLLTKESVLSSFLKKHEIIFGAEEKRLDLYYKDKEVCLDKVHESNVSYLRNRLGYNKGREDYCINGFAFRDLLFKNDYSRRLEDVPEFIGALACFLNCKKVGTDYYKNSQYYCLEYCIPLDKVKFDDDENLTLEQKEKFFLNKVLYRLYEYFFSNVEFMHDNDNPVLRLADFDTMTENYFVTREKITYEMLK
jgi:hypothetical protein